jgi:hypothetical protein
MRPQMTSVTHDTNCASPQGGGNPSAWRDIPLVSHITRMGQEASSCR